MEAEKKLEVMQDEIKLLKGELKQSLASVRDYLLNMELPSSEFSTILAALGSDGGGGGTQKITLEGNFGNPPAGQPAEEPKEDGPDVEEEVTEESIEPEAEMPFEEDDLISPDEPFEPDTDIPSQDDVRTDEDDYQQDTHDIPSPPEREELPEPVNEIDDVEEIDDTEEEMEEPYTPAPPVMDEEEMPEEEEPLMYYESAASELSRSIPRVNLLANLVNWVAKAKAEIGHEHLPMFLEVYGISGHLSPELKEAIINLSEITSEQAGENGTAEIWSQAMLSLHGILTGGDAPQYPLKPSLPDVENSQEPEEEETAGEEETPESPMKLKLVLPTGGGKSKEFCINLTPEADPGGVTE